MKLFQRNSFCDQNLKIRKKFLIKTKELILNQKKGFEKTFRRLSVWWYGFIKIEFFSSDKKNIIKFNLLIFDSQHPKIKILNKVLKDNWAFKLFIFLPNPLLNFGFYQEDKTSLRNAVRNNAHASCLKLQCIIFFSLDIIAQK